MFGWRRSISNLECDIIAVKGYLDGLNYRLNSLIKVSNRPDYRGDLSLEIKSVELEIEEYNKKIKQLIDMK
jgi:hypothetical protein